MFVEVEQAYRLKILEKKNLDCNTKGEYNSFSLDCTGLSDERSVRGDNMTSVEELSESDS